MTIVPTHKHSTTITTPQRRRVTTLATYLMAVKGPHGFELLMASGAVALPTGPRPGRMAISARGPRHRIRLALRLIDLSSGFSGSSGQWPVIERFDEASRGIAPVILMLRHSHSLKRFISDQSA